MQTGDKLLITTSDWFFAPDCQSYKAVWGTVKAVRSDTEVLGIKTNARSTNWYVEIGDLVIAGCQIHYAVKCDELNWQDYQLDEGKTAPCRVYNADKNTAKACNALPAWARPWPVDHDNPQLHMNTADQQVDELRTQLAERDALLRHIRDTTAGPAHRQQIDAALSASAEPCPNAKDLIASAMSPAAQSAPIERDERAEFEEWVAGKKVCKRYGAKVVRTCDGYGDYRINDRWLAWQARAALERKP